MVERLWSYWSVGLWIVGIVLIVYLVFRKSNMRRVFVFSLLGCATIYALSWWVYAAQADLPVRAEGTALRTQTSDLSTSLWAIFGLLFSFYGFLGTAAMLAVDEVVHLTAKRRTSTTTQ
jgi:hypothetical protein